MHRSVFVFAVEGREEIRQRTFAQLRDDVAVYAAAMRHMGVQEGDRVVGKFCHHRHHHHHHHRHHHHRHHHHHYHHHHHQKENNTYTLYIMEPTLLNSLGQS